FCAIRPPGRDAAADSAGRFGPLNALAGGAFYLRERWGVERVGVLEWRGAGGIGTAAPVLDVASGPGLFPVSLPTDASSPGGARRPAGQWEQRGAGATSPASGSKFAGDHLIEAVREGVRQMD